MSEDDYEGGYDERRFVSELSEHLVCPICMNILRDPVTCEHNEHCFCRSCITRHLTNSQNCPTCLDPLSPSTLKHPRLFRVGWGELRIKCKFSTRGCHTVVPLDNLETHENNCEYVPVQCGHDGCDIVVNKRDIERHENDACPFRLPQCHNCGEVKQDVVTLKHQVAVMNETLVTLSGEIGRSGEMRQKQTAEIKGAFANLPLEMARYGRQVGEVKQEVGDSRQEVGGIKQEVGGIKKEVGDIKQEVGDIRNQVAEIREAFVNLPQLMARLSGMTKEVGEMRHEMREYNKQLTTLCEEKPSSAAQLAEAKECSTTINVIVAGGVRGKPGGYQRLNSVEIFDINKMSWTQAQPMKTCHNGASSVVVDNQLIITGGFTGTSQTSSIEMLNITPVVYSKSWVECGGTIPGKRSSHASVVYHGRLVVIGGFDGKNTLDDIFEVLLAPPFGSKLLTKMPQARQGHAAHVVGNQIMIFGGKTSTKWSDNLDTVAIFDLQEKKWKQGAPLPYAVSAMASARWGPNVVLLGGVNSNGQALNTVILYDCVSYKHQMLPNMKEVRYGCAAVKTGNSIIVLGGGDQINKVLNSVEKFTFDTYLWEDLPPMNEARRDPTAAIC